VFVFFLRNSLFFSLLLSSSQTTTETRKHTTTTHSEEKHLFLKTIAEREKEKFSQIFVHLQKKTQKSHHKVTRKSAEKQRQLLITTTFALVFITHLLVTLYYTRARHKQQQHKQE
tara:strand:- start:1831 stop:2175 length:345 start_codon:yes stop_codon:yes gene_type:complete